MEIYLSIFYKTLWNRMISLGHRKLDEILGGGLEPGTTLMISYDIEKPVPSLLFKHMIPSLISQGFTILLSIYGNISYRRIFKTIKLLREKYNVEFPHLDEIHVLKVGGSSEKLFGKKIIHIPEGTDSVETVSSYISALVKECEKISGRTAIIAFGWGYFIKYYGVEGLKSLMMGVDLVRGQEIGDLVIHFYPENVEGGELSLLRKIFDISLRFYREEKSIKMEVRHSIDPFVDLRSYYVTTDKNLQLEIW